MTEKTRALAAPRPISRSRPTSRPTPRTGMLSGAVPRKIPRAIPRARLFRRAAVALLALLLFAVPALGEELLLDDGQVWGFAEALFKDGEYYRAISEYRRLIHFFPESPHGPDARLRVGEALLRGGEPEQAIGHFESLREQPAMAERLDDLRYLRGLSHLESQRGRPYPLREASIAAGLEAFRAIDPAWPGGRPVRDFLAAMDDPPELPQKSPALAGTLSAILPGTGSFYVGRYAEGSLALFVNVVLIYASVNAFEEDKDGLGLVLGGLAVAFYGGSIFAAANGAHKFNDGVRTRYLAQQRSRFGIVIDRGGLAGAFRRSF